MLRCTTPTNIIKVNLAPSVIKTLTVLYAQNKCVLLEKEIAAENIFPSEQSNRVCFARIDLTQEDTAAFANVGAGKVEIQLVVQTSDNAVLYSHIIQAEIGRVLDDKMFEDSIAGTGQLEIDYDDVTPIADVEFAPLTAVFDGEFDEVHYVSHPFEGLETDDVQVHVDNDTWTISAEFSESRKQELETLHSTSATRIDFTVDPKTYEMTIRLYNDKGEVIDTDTQDIPLELALVGIKWDEENRSVIFKTDAGVETPVKLSGISMLTDLQETSEAVTKAFQQALEAEQQARAESEQQIRDDLGRDILAETNAREEAISEVEQALEIGLQAADEALKQEVADRENAVTSERERAETAEQTNAAAIVAETERARQAEQTLTNSLAETTTNLTEKIETEQQRATTAEQDLAAQIVNETARAQTAEKKNTDAIAAEQQRATGAETELSDEIAAENERAIAKENEIVDNLDAAKTELQGNINAEQTRATSAEQRNATNIAAEKTRAESAESELGAEIDAIQELIPTQATADNQLADKNFVNSTVSTQTATFRGNFATKAALDVWQYENSTTATNNDYAVVMDDETHNHEMWRYKYSQPDSGFEGVWKEEYKINDAPLTAAQVAALNSEVTKEKLAAMSKATADEVTRAKAAEQVNADSISAETDRATAAEQANTKSITDEIARAKAAEQANSSAIATEKSRATAEEKKISDSVTAEQTRATGVETTLDNKIDTEIADRKAEITAEEKARDAAIKVETDRAKAEEAKKVNSAGGELKDTVVTFSDSEVTTDVNVASGDKTSTLWAKVKRWFGRLKALAFKATVGTGDIDAKAVTSAKLDDSVNSALNAAKTAVQPSALADIATSGNLSDGKQDATHRLVTDAEKEKWNSGAGTGDIPTKTSQLTNDGEDGTGKYATQSWVQNTALLNVVDKTSDERIGGQKTFTQQMSIESAIRIQDPADSSYSNIVDEEGIHESAKFNGTEYLVHKIRVIGDGTLVGFNKVVSLIPPLDEQETSEVEHTLATREWVQKQGFSTSISALTTRVAAVETKNTSQDTAIGNAQKTADAAMPKSGGTFTGGISVSGGGSINTSGYVTGTWLATTNATDLGTKPEKIAVIGTQGSANNYIYYRTPAEILSDIGAGTYTKPNGGIPKTDLASAVQTSLDKADSSLQAVPMASTSVLGGVKLGSDTIQSVVANNPSSTSGRTYPVQKNSSGQAVVNVPWTSGGSYSLPSATASVLGGIKVGAVRSTTVSATTGGTSTDKCYAVELDSANKAFVRVPWTDNNTTYGQATTGTLGLVKIAATARTSAITTTQGGTTANRYYGLEVDSTGKAFVNVPWTDNNTTYKQATTSTLGLIKIAASARTSAITTTQGGTTNNRYYGVEVDSNGKAFVNVPWENTHQSLANYYTKTQTDSAISTAIANAITTVLNTPV